MIFGINNKHEMCVWTVCVALFWNVSHSKQKWARYGRRRILFAMENAVNLARL